MKKCPGKQVEILYEPVAVKHKKEIVDLARRPQTGDKPLEESEKAVNHVFSRNIRTKDLSMEELRAPVQERNKR